MNKRGRAFYTITGVAIFCAGACAGYVINSIRCPLAQGTTYKEKRLPSTYRFINPLLECEAFQPTLHRFTFLKHQLNQYIESVISDKKASHVSVYLRDMTSGAWMGIHEHEEFAPASLLKVPVMLAVLKEAEKNPGLLSQELSCPASPIHIPQHFQPKDTPGDRPTTIEGTILKAIAYSDNDAANCLALNLPAPILDRVYTDLQMDIPGVQTPRDFISVKEYASFFRILYNSSYLSRPLSERALEILSQSAFDNGIEAGVPRGIVVAHKFGERSDNTLVKQLHDCGMIYHDRSPYLLCVMTKGPDLDKLPGIITNISRMVFEYYEKRLAEEKNTVLSPPHFSRIDVRQLCHLPAPPIKIPGEKLLPGI